ncbi:MAG TPA: orotidine 5'-phosphate decarboxylase / HUMPS family protein [Candidatus Babeliaceae bacterium]|nr:orotidine 5'-phosphate decarboxylase / HUMPS family protein [Candidatus Babeliaceae bacterium]
MKLQIAFDLTDLDKARSIALEIYDYADIIEVGSLLIYRYGDQALRTFKELFPNKMILADTKIADRGKEAATIFCQAGADWITVLAGTGRSVIHAVTTTAHEYGKKVMLDLIDASSLGQSALEAKSLGVDALLFHRPAGIDEQLTFLDRWDMVKGNTTLPVFISASLTPENSSEIIAVNPAGIVVGTSITHAENPVEVAAFFRALTS